MFLMMYTLFCNCVWMLWLYIGKWEQTQLYYEWTLDTKWVFPGGEETKIWAAYSGSFSNPLMYLKLFWCCYLKVKVLFLLQASLGLAFPTCAIFTVVRILESEFPFILSEVQLGVST